MLINCTRINHACTSLRLCQIPGPSTRFTFNSIIRNNRNVVRQPLQLMRRPHHHLCNIRPPARTPGQLPPGLLNSRWSAHLLTLRRCLPTSKVKLPKAIQIAKSKYIRLLTLMKSERWVLGVGLTCLVVSSAITMSVPFFLGKVVDVVFDKDGLDDVALTKLREYSMMLFVVFVLGGLANYARVYLFGAAALRIVRRLRSKLYRAMIMQEVGWYDTKGSGELINRLSNDTYYLGVSLSQNISDGLRSTAMIMVGSGMMVYTSPKLALVSVCVVPVLAGMAIVYGRYVRHITRSELDKFAEIMKYAEERFGNIRAVKLFCREQNECSDYDAKLDQALEIGYKETRARSIFFGLTGFSGNFIIISVLYYGGTLVLNNELTIGAMTAFMLYAGYVAISMNGLSNFYSQLNKGIGASDRIWEIIDRPYAMPLNKGIVPKAKPIGEIIFQNVHFHYPSRTDAKILNNFSLILPPNQTTAVVGRSGSGKSTVALLLMRLYDPQEGNVYLDKHDLRTVNPQWLRNNMGVVSQDPVLFSSSIRSNILYGVDPAKGTNEDLLQQVVIDSNVIEFTSRLPDGLDTIVGQRGVLLSGGQKQRVAIARALIKDPTILVLDEATSSLDSVSEQLVQSALVKLIQGRTVLTIAHRLSTIYNAHKIAVVDNGQIVEEGTYDILMGNPNGAFRELVSMQAFAGRG